MSYYANVLFSLLLDRGLARLPDMEQMFICTGVVVLCQSLRDPYTPLPPAVQETLWASYWREFSRKLEVF